MDFEAKIGRDLERLPGTPREGDEEKVVGDVRVQAAPFTLHFSKSCVRWRKQNPGFRRCKHVGDRCLGEPMRKQSSYYGKCHVCLTPQLDQGWKRPAPNGESM